jgi:Ala-tRNA(Pro) deacylase
MQSQASCKSHLEQFLREHGVDYELQHHAVTYTARGVAASEHVSARRIAKTVMVVADGQLVMVVIRGSDELDPARLASALGVTRARLADEAEFGPALPDCEVGAMPPFGNLYGLQVFVDMSLMQDETIRFQAGTHADTICMRYHDFDELVQPKMVYVARTPLRLSIIT